MGIFNHIRAVSETEKALVVKKLIANSTPNFDFFLLTILSVLMATFGMIENNAAVVIGSMLIAPVLFPILSLSLSVVMSDYHLIQRAGMALIKAAILGIAASAFAALFFALGSAQELTPEIISRTEPTLLSFAIAVVAGFAVAYTLAKEHLSETLPGIAVAVALIPPLSTIGIGIAFLNWSVVAGASVYLLINVVGIVFTSMLVFSLMDLYAKRDIATRVATKADNEVKAEEEKIKKVLEKETTHK